MINPSVGGQDTYREFGCGIEPAEWQSHFDTLSEETRTRVMRVADRVRTTRLLRYVLRRNLVLTDATETSWFQGHDVPSLEMAYLFGCLDTLSDSSDTDFAAWMHQKKRSGKLTFIGPITTLEEFMSNCLERYKDYKKDSGVGAGFKRLFRSIVDTVPGFADWLGESVRVRRIRGNPPREEDLDSARAIEHLMFHHIYRRRRNRYTHESETPYIYIEDDIRNDEGWSARNGTFLIPDGNKRWSLYVRYGMDEATLLRVMVYVAVLHILEMHPTRSHIGAYFTALSRQSACYGFLWEVQENIAALNRLSEFAAHPSTEEDMIFYRSGVPPLSNEWATKLSARYRVDSPYELMLKDFTDYYTAAVSKLNEHIAALNAAHPPSDATPAEWPVVNARREFIVDCVREIEDEPGYEFVKAPVGLAASAIKIEYKGAHDRILHLAKHPWLE